MEADSKTISGVGFGLAKTKSDWWGLAKPSLQFCSQSLLQAIVSSWVCFHTFEFPHCLEPPEKTEIASRSFCEHAESKYKVKSHTVYSTYVLPCYQINEGFTKKNACTCFITWRQSTVKVIFIPSPWFTLDFLRQFFLSGRCIGVGGDGAHKNLLCDFHGDLCSGSVHQGHTSHLRSTQTASAVSVSGLFTLCFCAEIGNQDIGCADKLLSMKKTHGFFWPTWRICWL